MSKLNLLSIFPTPEEKEKLWERVSEAFVKKQRPSISFSEFLAIGIQWVNEQIRPEIEALRAYSIEIHNDPTVLTLEKLISSHRTLRGLRLDTKEGYNAEMKAGYEHGKQIAMMHVAENTIQFSDLRKMTMQEIANLVGEEES